MARCCIQSGKTNRAKSKKIFGRGKIETLLLEILHGELNIRMHPALELPTAGGIIGHNISPKLGGNFEYLISGMYGFNISTGYSSV
jgi:hypothetical protein